LVALLPGVVDNPGTAGVQGRVGGDFAHGGGGFRNQTLIARCLDRHLKNRLRDIGEARLAIQQCLADPERGRQPTPPAALVPSRK
jgi:hypothetical protein